MEKHFELSDAEFESQFSKCQLLPELFSHEAHLRLAWIHIDKYGVNKAEENILKQLRGYVTFLGAEHKFNVTLTLAAIRAVYHFWLQSNSASFQDFILEFPRLKYDFKGLIASHYSFDLYNSDQAKNQFVTPDLLPFD